jgi:hypothetical protein
MNEHWLPVVGYTGLYEVSSSGRIRSVDHYTECTSRWGGVTQRFHRGRILCSIWKQTRPKDYPELGYYVVSLCKEGAIAQKMVHRLVLEAFTGLSPEECEGAHVDGDVSNNAAINLQWKTAQENSLDRVRHGTQTRKSDCCPRDNITGRFYRRAE